MFPDFAKYWADRLGTPASSLVKLKGGINNFVYRCGVKRYWVIKGYPSIQSNFRDGLQAEVDFLKYSELVAPGYTPKLISVDKLRRCVVLEYIHGTPFADKICPPDYAVKSAVEFFRKLNSPNTSSQIIQLQAVEGFMSISEHLLNIQNRIERMQVAHIPNAYKTDAELFLDKLYKDYECITSKIEHILSVGYISDSITKSQLCISPSDFGFHNAIQTDIGIRFYDFEFAGWDDPAKAAADFILQPRVPVLIKISPLIDALPLHLRHQTIHRLGVLLPILKLKWIAIILSTLNPARLSQIIALNGDSQIDSLISERFDNAQAFIKANEDISI
ncbi:hypothetical protein SynA15127_02370 [Synechococcus sp. A15-127]|uniref:hypothetical protein n=1 Tax=Synechococcus sp. A15-127 TaxID=1050624 RepID=UPI0016479977|nr:hypothetical protein [Synechococcus sp. A15-127]QNI95434.1 hypothetical protein SynA15127_02370 [Synechococcus sp. A15-127]